MSFEAQKIDGAIANQAEFYRQLNVQLHHLLEGETDWLANLSNAAALLYLQLEDINWAGFYLWKNEQLILGPFQGKPACVRIALGSGVCGTAAKERVTQVVQDVHQFPGHIACDPASRSEIVVPILIEGRLFGVLDIDSPVTGRFAEVDRAGLEEFVRVLVGACDWRAC